jgi:NAD(P)-dependent dehydrogenase (short-subunit alcohol dehydrogenase family)
VAPAPRAYWGLYGAAKAGQEHLVRSWALEVARTPLRVSLFDPGPVATQLRAVAMPGEKPASLRRPEEVAPDIAALCLPGEAPPHGEVVRAVAAM